MNIVHHDLPIVKQTATQQKPLDRMLASFPDAHQRSNGWWAHEDNPRFDFLEKPDGDIRVHSHTGRTVDDVLAMGKPPLSRAHLYAKPGQWSAIQQRDQLDLLTLAEYMCLDWRFLFNEGCSDEYRYRNSKCVKLGGYCLPDGSEHSKHQIRLSLHKEPRFLWNENTPGDIIACGYGHLDRARVAGYAVIGEGNSDYMTMTFHGIPFLGIPGADQARKLDVDLLQDIPVLYIIEEPDQARKLQRSGQGFYKNVRAHLRENGYPGKIYSIRFMDVTGYKDPSDLHKAIYQACKEQAEGPFRNEVHKQFLAAIEQAREQAIPEGNDNLFPIVQPRDWSKITYEEFCRRVWKVPSEFLTHRQKTIVCYLFLYMREVKPTELGWQIDADIMAPEVGLRGTKGAKTFRAELCYLHQKLGILHKELRAKKEYVNGEDNDMEQIRYKGTLIYYAPSPTFYTPGGYCVVSADQHKPGGPRETEEPSIAPSLCVNCGSENLDRYEWQHCMNCNYDHFKPLYDSPPLSHDNDTPPEEQVIETTLNTVSAEQVPESPKMGSSGAEQDCSESSLIESITQPQNGVVGKSLSHRSERPCNHCGSYEMLQRDDGRWLCECYFPVTQQLLEVAT